MSIRESIQTALDEAAETLDLFRRDADQIANTEAFAQATVQVLQSGGRLLACGNGGSMSQAMHFAEEWTGRFRRERGPVPALCFSDPTEITCIANDFGFEEVFARMVEAHGRRGDLMLLLSTSGNSPNLLRAAKRARSMGIRTVALLGRGGGKLASEVDLPILVPRARTSDRIQEVHLHILHTVIEAVERQIFPNQAERALDPR